MYGPCCSIWKSTKLYCLIKLQYFCNISENVRGDRAQTTFSLVRVVKVATLILGNNNCRIHVAPERWILGGNSDWSQVLQIIHDQKRPLFDTKPSPGRVFFTVLSTPETKSTLGPRPVKFRSSSTSQKLNHIHGRTNHTQVDKQRSVYPSTLTENFYSSQVI